MHRIKLPPNHSAKMTALTIPKLREQAHLHPEKKLVTNMILELLALAFTGHLKAL